MFVCIRANVAALLHVIPVKSMAWFASFEQSVYDEDPDQETLKSWLRVVPRIHLPIKAYLPSRCLHHQQTRMHAWVKGQSQSCPYGLLVTMI